MNEELIQEAGRKAGNYYKSGYNCAEAIFLAFREYLAPEIDPEMVKLMTGLGGGVGHAGCMCGALSGSVVAINMLKGRITPEVDQDITHEFAKEFHDRFKKQYGATCCRILNKYDFHSKEHIINCLKITGKTGSLLMEYLLEKGLYAPAEAC